MGFVLGFRCDGTNLMFVLNDLNADVACSGQYLAVASSDVRVYTSKTWDLIKSFTDYKSDITGVRFGDHALYLATSSKDKVLRVISS